ncbi:hypothetical protein RJ639_028837 [Escallonia herrerae]|uniref:K-box domain-containing protein n=1 Tax=Escallonia herrerae TaxID=1293975 RepID=A0AA89BPF3_9ASTE|nr:hypothetical protein RJ639_028837 [Escallonia herrerae]
MWQIALFDIQWVMLWLKIGPEACGTWNSADLLQMVQRNLDGEKAKELNMTELTQLEHQLNAILRQTRLKKEKRLREEKQLLEEEVVAGITEREEN